MPQQGRKQVRSLDRRVEKYRQVTSRVDGQMRKVEDNNVGNCRSAAFGEWSLLIRRHCGLTSKKWVEDVYWKK